MAHARVMVIGWAMMMAACAEPTSYPPHAGTRFASTYVGDELAIHMFLPDDYDTSSTRYPTVYFLDAYESWVEWKFELARRAIADGRTPPFIAVGVGYDGDVRRNRDYTYPADPALVPDSGGGEAFYQFLVEELIPQIDASYRTDGRRVLVGHSYGGYFTVFAFFHTRPDHRPFQGFVAASASIQWSSGWIFGREAEVASELSDLPASLYMNFGTIEPAFLNAYLDELIDRIGSRNYPSVALRAEHVPDAQHCCTEERGWLEGIPFVLR